MNLICQGLRSKQEMINETLEEYGEMYVKIKRDFDVLVEVSFVFYSPTANKEVAWCSFFDTHLVC
jgi:hypothetical protein